jgi:hypothetical protein
MIALSGVRSSWLTTVTKFACARVAYRTQEGIVARRDRSVRIGRDDVLRERLEQRALRSVGGLHRGVGAGSHERGAQLGALLARLLRGVGPG